MRAVTSLARRLTLPDAVVLGLGSMIGAGVFVVFAPAAAAAGSWLLAALALAGVVAFCNATSSAQLAAQYPTSGGTYVYGRERLGEWPGFLAGWGFVVGKTASASAMALTASAYLVPEPWQRPAAVVAVVALASVNYRGVTRTARLTRVIVALVLAVLAAVVVANLAGSRPVEWVPDAADASPYGVLQAAGLLFFAFAGYARLATLGEEVVDPGRTIPRAIVLALGLTVVLYAAVAVGLLGVLGVDGLAAARTPVLAAVEAGPAPWLGPAVRAAGGLAALGALLALVAGIGRTALAMAREGDLPRWLAAVHPRFRTPHRAEVALAVVVSVLVLLVDLRGAIGFSSFGVLLYYLVANVAALTQDAEHRRYPRWWAVAGAVLCVVLVATLPWQSVVAGVAVLLVGVAYRLVRRAQSSRASSST